MEFIPTNNSLHHTEYRYTRNTITIVNTDVDEYKIDHVTYTHPRQYTIDDLSITFAANTWTYASKFEYVSRSPVYYSYSSNDLLHDQTLTIQYGFVENIRDVPSDFIAAYRFDPPDDTTPITFNVEGLTRHATYTTDGDQTSTKIWGNWYRFSTTYTIYIDSDYQMFIQLVQSTVKKGKLATTAPKIPGI